MIIDLRKPNLENIEIGDVVITPAGFRFELVHKDGDGAHCWIDTESKITWESWLKATSSMEVAFESGFTLPTKEEFELAEQHGIRAIFSMNGKRFWTSSGVSTVGFAYIFDGTTGKTFMANNNYSDIYIMPIQRRTS